MKWERFVSVPVFGVLLTTGFVYYITVLIFTKDWLGLQESAKFWNALIFSLLVFLCMFSFFVCVLTDPGHVPSSYIPDVEDSDPELKNNNALQARRCDKCSIFKPPRAHHCKICRRCVLRMDHHCMWVNNCIGYWNYKAFFALVSYATIGSIHSAIIIIGCTVEKDWDFIDNVALKTFYVSSAVVMVSLSIIFGFLWGWHVYLIAHNMTTIEYYEGIRAAWLAKKSGQSYRHPFDIGLLKNFTLVLGPNMLKWLCPTAVSHLKDGISFRFSRNGS